MKASLATKAETKENEPVREFNGKPVELPKWEEKEPGMKFLAPVIIGKKPELEVKEERKPCVYMGKEIPALSDYNKHCLTICDLCEGTFGSTYGFVYRKHLEEQLKYCGPCNYKRKASTYAVDCKRCHTTFVSSEYWCEMMGKEFPTLCADCRRKRHDKLRKLSKLPR